MSNKEFAYRWWLFLSSVFSVSITGVLVGCSGPSVRLNELVVAPEFIPGRADVFDRISGLPPSYKMMDDDALTLRPKFAGCPLSLEAVTDSVFPTKLPVIKDEPEATIPVFFVTRFDWFLVKNCSRAGSTQVTCFVGPGNEENTTKKSCKDAAERVIISDLRMGKIDQAFSTSSLTVVPVVAQSDRALPGDVVDILLNAVVVSEAGYKYPVSVYTSKTVSNEGYISISELNNPSQFLNNAAKGNLFPFRMLYAAHAPLSARVRVFWPNITYEEQPTLARIARCLGGAPDGSSVPDLKPWDAAEREWCVARGYDDRFKPDDVRLVQKVRYELSLARATWTLIDHKGEKHAVPYVSGLPVLTAIREAYPQLTGMTLDDAWYALSRVVYVTVVPRKLGNSGAGQSGTAAFYSDYGPAARETNHLGSIRLLPGDTVIVSRNEPQMSTR